MAAAGLMLAGCGGGSAGTTSRQGEREANVALLDTAIGREMAIVDAYDHGLSLFGGPASWRDGPLLVKLRAQDQEHVDALLKAIRGLGGQVDPVKVAGEREALEYSGVKTRADFLALAYELEGKGVVGDLDEVARLTAGWPRAMIASTATNQAQHLVLLRQALGAGPLGSVPAPFETGTTPAP
ncbi:MAG: ferritin-like domain-containing protein [Solirubrobacterales bacterium]